MSGHCRLGHTKLSRQSRPLLSPHELPLGPPRRVISELDQRLRNSALNVPYRESARPVQMLAHSVNVSCNAYMRYPESSQPPRKSGPHYAQNVPASVVFSSGPQAHYAIFDVLPRPGTTYRGTGYVRRCIRRDTSDFHELKTVSCS